MDTVKGMAKIPFTLEKWLKDKSQRVETRDGRIVHNIWRVKEPTYTNNRKAEVCALIDGEEDALVFFEGGRYLPTTRDTDNPFDLFIVTPELELTEFEQSVRNCIIENLTTHIKDGNGGEMSSTVFIDGDTTKKLASELFGIARTQLQTEGLVTMEHLNIACEAEYQSGLADGKNEALNDLPRWKKIGRGNNYSSEVKFAINGRYLEMNDTLNDVYEVALSNLEKLPKEE